jgi:4-amino-4-deoxy-L-arabinose transferase-like glycosyltransferase
MTAPMTTVDTIDPSIGTAPEEGRWTRPAAIAVVFLAALACFLPLPPNSPLAGTEGHRSVTAHQMAESGEWLVPRMYGRVYLAKPPLHYWILATFEKVSGVASPFIWRLPSAVEASILAATLCWLAWRWFGQIAGIVGGISYIALVAMWGQDRGADIDLTNALMSTIAAICLLEMQFGPTSPLRGHRVWYTLLGGVAVGASFLTKGPCGLPPILGAMIWIAIATVRQHRANRMLWPSFWLPLIIGAAIFAIYAFATYRYIHSHHMAADLTGVQEGTEDLHPHDWTVSRAIGIFMLPLIMFAYALPVSLALPLSFLREVRDGHGREGRARMQALALTILLAWAVCFVSGMHLPRYAYVTLPLLCPLAGAVAASAPQLGPAMRRLFAVIAGASALILALVVFALTAMLWRHSHIRPLLIITAIIALPIGVAVFRALYGDHPSWRALYALPIILLCLSLNSAYLVHYDRLRRSSLDQGLMIRNITGPDAQLFTCAMVLDQPELFYYAGLPTHAFDGDNLDWHDIQSGSWVVLEPQELDIWQREVPNRLKRIIPFVANKNPGDLVWYADESATTGL